MADLSPVQELKNYLIALENQGVSAVSLDEGARSVLRVWLQGGVVPATVPAVDPEVSAIFDKARRQVFDGEAEEDEEGCLEPIFRVAGETKEEQLAFLVENTKHWDPVRQLTTLRPSFVFAPGNINSPIMFVGDAVNYIEEQSGVPFSGRYEEKFEKILSAMELDRESIYLTHVVKFRPSLPSQMTNDRPPTKEEIDACLPILLAEIDIVRPRVIVALGVNAAQALLSLNTPLSALRRREFKVHHVPVVVTHHPRFLLTTDDMREKRLFWEDMLRAMELAHLPISERQRRFFS